MADGEVFPRRPLELRVAILVVHHDPLRAVRKRDVAVADVDGAGERFGRGEAESLSDRAADHQAGRVAARIDVEPERLGALAAGKRDADELTAADDLHR